MNSSDHFPPSGPAAAGSPEPVPARARGWVAWTALAVVALVLLALTANTLVARARSRASIERDTRESLVPVVTTIHPARTDTAVVVDLPGDVTAFEETPIYARVSGYLKKWHTDIGTPVTEGDLLAEIETPELDQQVVQTEAALAQARANLEIARTSAERWTNLLRSDAVAQQDVDVKTAAWRASEADVRAAEANVSRLREMVKFKRLTAPFSGIITERTVDAGTLINAGASREVFRLSRINPLRVFLSLPQAYSQMVRSNDTAVLTLAELPGRTFTGLVDRTAGAIDPGSRTLRTEVLVTNQDGVLLPGSHAMVRLKMATGSHPVVVPVNTLLFRDEKGVQVGVVDSAGAVHLANVTIGRDYGTTVEIVHGLSEADNVVVNPSDSLVEGQRVTVAAPSPASPPAKHD